MINKSEREQDMMRFQNAIAPQIWLDCFDTPPDILLVKQEHLCYLFIDSL